MRLTGKFALIATLVATLASSIMAAAITPTTRFIVESGSTIYIDSVLYTLHPATNDTTTLKNALKDNKSVSITVTYPPNSEVATGTHPLKLADGRNLTITAVAPVPGAPITQTLTIAFTGAVAATTLSSPILSNAVSAVNDDFTVTNPVVGNLVSFAVAGHGAELVDAIAKNSVFVGVASSPFIHVAHPRPDVAVDATTTTLYCYTFTDKNLELCLAHAANAPTYQVSVGPKYVAPVPVWKAALSVAGPPSGVVVIALLLSVPMSYLHAFIDPQGYQAGKDASFYPLKSFLADTDFASENPYGENYDPNSDSGEVRVDPQTGRPIRPTGKNPVTGEEYPSDAPDAETTSAYGVSVMAAVLMVPFLL